MWDSLEQVSGSECVCVCGVCVCVCVCVCVVCVWCDTNQSFWTEAYRNLQVARKKVAQRYNQARKLHPYGVGDLVRYQLKLSSSKAQTITPKLM